MRQATDVQGAVTAAREWTPYGVAIGGAQPGLGYAGEWFDADVEAQYLRARWYDVATGRFTSEDVWEGDYQQPQSIHSYVYARNNAINLVDPSGLCSYQDSDCQRFVEEVRQIISISKSNPRIKYLGGDWAIVSILAEYYAGIPATFQVGTCPLWLPISTQAHPKERYPVYPPTGHQGDWPYKPNKMYDPEDHSADAMRAQYGFKRPYYQNTHHYFAVFYLESLFGFGFGPWRGRMYDEANLEDRLDQIHSQNDPNHQVLWDYEVLWIDMHYDLYVNEMAAEHAHYILRHGIETLPDLLKKELCAENELDVWSLQTTVFSGAYEPNSSLTPWWERKISVPWGQG